MQYSLNKAGDRIKVRIRATSMFSLNLFFPTLAGELKDVGDNTIATMRYALLVIELADT
jgi:hypothetical protein